MDVFQQRAQRIAQDFSILAKVVIDGFRSWDEDLDVEGVGAGDLSRALDDLGEAIRRCGNRLGQERKVAFYDLNHAWDNFCACYDLDQAHYELLFSCFEQFQTVWMAEAE